MHSDSTTSGEPTPTTFHELADGFVLEIAGTGGRSVDQLRAMYRPHQVPEPDREADVRCELATDHPDPDVVLGRPQEHYGRRDDRFVVRRSGSTLTVDRGWRRMAASPDWEPYHTVYLIEFELRRRMAASGWALLHGCGFRVDGTTVVCPSLRGAGKTNTLFAVLQSGGAYLSDDRVWVNAAGDVRGYPVPVNPHTEQYRSFPDLTEPDATLGDRVADGLERRLDPDRSVVEAGLLLLSARLLAADGRTFRSLEDLLPDAIYLPRAEADRLVLLRAAPGQEQVTVEGLAEADAARAFELVHHYEWNALLTEYFLAFDALFPSGERTRHLDRVLAAEERVFEDLLSEVPASLLKIPRERDWEASGVSDGVREAMGNLAGQAPERQEPRTGVE